MVEFYDRRYDFDKWRRPVGREGQFITRHYLSTLRALRDPPHTGLCLDGGTEDWAISGETLEQVVIWAGDDLADLSRRVGRIFDDMKADALKRLPACTAIIEDHGRRRQYELEQETPREYVSSYLDRRFSEYTNLHDVNHTYVGEIRSAGL